jgi:hypothetical protein
MDLIIRRSKWCRGEGSGQSQLLRPSDGKMCCLGFYALALGLKEEQIHSKDAPHDAPMREGAEWLYDGNDDRDQGLSDECYELMEINDQRFSATDCEFPEEQREAAIIKGFAEQGVNVTFVDE